MKLKQAHFLFGLFMFVVFLLSGQYMDKVLGHLKSLDVDQRLLYRTRHIFLLSSGLLHLSLGLYLQPLPQIRSRKIQYAGSLVLFTSSMILISAFFREAALKDLTTPYSHVGLFLSLFGVSLHIIAHFANWKFI